MAGGHIADLPFFQDPVLINKDRITKLKRIAIERIFGLLTKLSNPVQYAPLVESRYLEQLKKKEEATDFRFFPEGITSIIQLISPFISSTKIDEGFVMMLTQSSYQSQLALKTDIWVIDVSVFI